MENRHGTTGQTWHHTKQAIEIIVPSFVLCENVAGLCSAKRDEQDVVAEPQMGKIMEGLRSEGMKSTWALSDASKL